MASLRRVKADDPYTLKGDRKIFYDDYAGSWIYDVDRTFAHVSEARARQILQDDGAMICQDCGKVDEPHESGLCDSCEMQRSYDRASENTFLRSIEGSRGTIFFEGDSIRGEVTEIGDDYLIIRGRRAGIHRRATGSHDSVVDTFSVPFNSVLYYQFAGDE